MRRSSSLLALLALLPLAAASACSPTEGASGACEGLLPGDLVISEVFADPAGDDAGKEWFEIYNAGSAPVDLEGLTLVSSKNDKTGERGHEMPSRTVGNGDYFVLGGVTDDLRPAHVDYGYGNDLGALRNSEGRLALRCGETIIDEMTYPSMGSNASRAFTGLSPPDGVVNDDEATWCQASLEYEVGAKGTPGAPNETCTPVGPPTECRDGSVMRPLVLPAAGDLVITEWMPNPKAADDSTGEWFEVLVTRDVDLNGLELGTVSPTVRDRVTDTACLRRTAGTRVVFARSTTAGQNGTLPVVDFTFDFGLTNTNGAIFVGVGGAVLDQVMYATSGDGVSTALDPSKSDPADNDLPQNLCAGTATFGAGDKGTPGTANLACGSVPMDDMCSDGGTMRALVKPEPGDLVISEWMPNPKAASDATGEWFEVRVLRDVDLNGLELGRTPPTVDKRLTATACLRRTAGTHVLFARSTEDDDNGALPPVDFDFSFGLNNSNATLFIGAGGVVLDQVTYATSGDGISTAIDPAATSPDDNDELENRCPGTETFGAGDKGSPGRANLACP